MKRIKMSLFIANLSKICAIFIFFVYFIAAPVCLSSKTLETSYEILLILECVLGTISYASFRVYNTNGYKGGIIVSKENIPEDFYKLYKNLEEEWRDDLQTLRKDLPFRNVLKIILPVIAVLFVEIGIISLMFDYRAITFFAVCIIVSIFIGIVFFILDTKDINPEKEYEDYYKKNCIKSFIKLFNPNWIYEPQDKIKEEQFLSLYKNSKCDDYERYRVLFR